MACGGFKDLAKRTASNKVLRDRAFNIAKNPKYDGYQRDLASAVYKSFHKNSSSSSFDNKIKQNEELAEELPKSVIKTF